MIAQRLKVAASPELAPLPAQPHLDEDVIAAFVEGRLGDSECQPVLAPLAACGACRRASAQMVQLENQVDSEPAGDVADEPGRLGLLLSKFGSMVSATGEEVVFAYQDSEEEEKKEQSPNMPATNDNQQ